MLQLLQRGVPVPTQHSSAAVRALQLSTVQDSIVASTPPHLLGMVAKVNKNLYRATHTPAVWCAQYAPAHADLESRTIYTSLPPPLERKSAYLTAIPDRPESWPLGRCRGEEWYLRYQPFDPTIHAEQTKQILDAVTAIHFCGLFAADANDTPEQAWEKMFVGNRSQAYIFMKDRLYRLDHGLPISVYSHGGKSFLAMAAMTAAAIVGIGRCDSALQEATNTLGTVAATAGIAGCVILLALNATMGVCAVTFGGDAALRNALVGPLDHVRCNRWARQIPELEAAAKQLAEPEPDDGTQH